MEKKFDCPHCQFDREYRNLERGKVQVSASYAKTKVEGVPDVIDCPACDGLGYIHPDIMTSLDRYCMQHNIEIAELVAILKNGSDHFYFWRNNMYHGVEFTKGNRGYIGT